MPKQILDYTILQTLYQGVDTVIYRCMEPKNQTTLVFKTPGSDHPTIERLAKLQHEYEILKNLDIPGVIATYGLQKYENSSILMLEDFRGMSLKSYIQSAQITVEDFLRYAILLANTLGDIHANHVVHRDIKPENILINPEKSNLKFIDFGIASVLSQETAQVIYRRGLIGTLHYISPEQTGRINRDVDYRTDIYSLGVTLYEMITGRLPFTGEDAIELVHSHIAKAPPPPDKLIPSLPRVISDIILKCLAKMPEERYQSAYGLKIDLEECLKQLLAGGTIADFTPGENDIKGLFRISQKLYGREEEIHTLMQAFDRVTHGVNSELILVRGPAGSGKTTLVQEIHKPIVKQRGYFISGKFDQLQREIPYTALIQAFRELVLQVLTEDEEHLAIIRGLLNDALQGNGQLIIDLIPEIELIIGKQNIVPSVGAEESQNRLKLFLIRFIHTFAKKDHPLIIFLDDIQWANASSFNLIQTLVTTPGLKYVLVIGAYRDHEVDLTHPFNQMLEQIKKSKGIIHTVTISPLHLSHIVGMIVDLLNCTREQASPLAQLLLKKTGGNPFFLIQYIKKLRSDNQIEFDGNTKRWFWDLEAIEKLEVAQNVIELMIKKILLVPKATQDILSMASCIGVRFPIRLLSQLTGMPMSHVLKVLWNAITEDLIKPVGNEYQLIESNTFEEEQLLKLEDKEIAFQFLHDKIQQAAYEMLDESEKKRIHYKIGSFLKASSPENVEAIIFEITYHLNKAISIVNNNAEKLEIARLNLIACRKAKKSAAFQTAYENINQAKKLLGENAWDETYDIAYAVFMEAAECCFLVRRFDEIEPLSDIILKNARTNIEKGRLYILKMRFYTNIARTHQAIDEARDCLRLFDITIPKDPGKLRVLVEMLRVKMKLGKDAISKLEYLPPITDPERSFIMDMMISMLPPAFLVSKNLLAYLTFKLMSLSLAWGSHPNSFFIYSSYASVIEVLFKDYKQAYELGLLAIKLSEKTNNIGLKCRVWYVMGVIINHWSKPLKTSEEYMEKTLLYGMESGELAFIAYLVASYGSLEGAYQRDLNESYKRMEKYRNLLLTCGNEQAMLVFIFKSRIARHLHDRDYEGLNIADKDLDEVQLVQKIRSNPELAAAFQSYTVYKGQTLYIFGKYDEAFKLYEESAIGFDKAKLLINEREISFFKALTIAAVYSTAGFFQRLGFRRELKKFIKLHRIWTLHCPANNSYRYAMLQGELARIDGKYEEAFQFYDKAIQLARKYECQREEAVANELAGKLYYFLGKRKTAKGYLDEAHYCYYRWGCLSKVRHMEIQYPDILGAGAAALEISSRPQYLLTNPTTARTITLTQSSPEKSKSSLDLSSVLRAATILSGEIQLDNLVRQLLSIVIENAGADKAIFLMEEGGRWYIKGQRTAEEVESDTIVQNVEISSNKLPMSLLQYVIRTNSYVVLDNPTKAGRFTRDPYIIAHKPKSVLCFPMMHQGKLTSLFYLENSSTSEAFSARGLEVLNLLTGQITVSLENASLYTKLKEYNRTLESKVSERTKELQEKNTQLQEAFDTLKDMQKQVFQQEKLAALGSISQGLAHEIKNPLNFINNFSTLSIELLQEVEENLDKAGEDIEERKKLLDDLKLNLRKIHEHSKRIDGIVVSMLQHGKAATSSRETSNINHLLQEYLTLATEKMHQKNPDVPMRIETDLETGIAKVPIVAQDMGRCFMNIFDNSCYALLEKRKLLGESYMPSLHVTSKELEDAVEILIRDNGTGVPQKDIDQVFLPFFTTKPTGTGTGLGLSIAYDIVVHEHKGQIKLTSKEGEFTEFLITIPKK